LTEQTVKDLNFLDIWTNVLENISESISKPSFETWIAPLTAHFEGEDLIRITAQNDFAKDWVETRYKELLFEMIRKVAGRTFELEFISIIREKDTTQTIYKLDRRQALGYFFLACNEGNVPNDTINEIYKNMCWQFDRKTPEDAEKEGYEWYHSLNNVK
jgi:chromosomal replication initiation ATPase DnaA